MPLTPIQRWWLSDDPVDPHHYNQSVLLEAREPMNAAALQGAVRAVIAHHDALRLRVSRGEQGWEQRIVPFDGTVPFERVDLGGLPEQERAAAVTAAAERAQASLDLGAGPLVRVVLFATIGRGRRRPAARRRAPLRRRRGLVAHPAGRPVERVRSAGAR